MTVSGKAGRIARAAGRELVNRSRYGAAAPRVAERIWVDPLGCTRRYGHFPPGHTSGSVRAGDWDRAAAPLETHPIHRLCVRHWGDGLSWEEAGAYAYQLERIRRGGGEADGCRTIDDVVRRYERLDELFATIRREGRLRTRSELPGWSIREFHGICMHIGRDGDPIFGQRGHHRLAIARCLALPVIPAQLGVVHPGALGVWRAQYARDPGA